IRFDNIFGTAATQIPVGARINAAALTVNVGTASTDRVFLNRMIVDWNQASSTWNSLGGGVQTNDVKAVSIPDSTLSPADGLGFRSFNVTSSVQAWSTNTPNRGWVVTLPSGTTNWEFDSSELGGSTTPMLAVDWTAPAPGTLNFSAPTYSASEGAGTTVNNATI